MYVLNHERINKLTEHHSPCSVSLFMPTHRTGPARRQDPIRLKNLLSAARQNLLDAGQSSAVAREILHALNELRFDEIFWRRRGDGLACYCAPETFSVYRVPLRLDEQLFVNDHFHVKPLLPMLRSDARLYILAITQDTARLYEATKYSIREIQLANLARDGSDDDEPELQFHSHQSPAQGKGATETALYHGHGGADRAKAAALKFCQRVDHVVVKTLQGQQAPLVLACVGYLAAIYDSANRYPRLIHGKIPGSPDRWSDDELRDQAWRIVEPHLRERQQEAWRKHKHAESKGRASSELRRVVLAAEQGRIDTLFLQSGEQRWGFVDPQLQAVHVGEKERANEELLDYAAIKTLGAGGDVFLLDAQCGANAPAAATFRY